VPVRSFALDENVADPAAGLLRSRGILANSATELDRLGLSDAEILLQASRNGQTLLSHNGRDFVLLHEAWVTWRRHWTTEAEQQAGISAVLSRHAGILIIPTIPIRDLARILEQVADIARSIADRLFGWSVAGGWHEPGF
jgi:hypothetical protein